MLSPLLRKDIGSSRNSMDYHTNLVYDYESNITNPIYFFYNILALLVKAIFKELCNKTRCQQSRVRN